MSNNRYFWDDYWQRGPLDVKNGIKARTRRGDVGATWWSRRWVSVIESFNMGDRLDRGRYYARRGQVMSIEIEPGVIRARVQGSRPRPYTVLIKLKPLTARQWNTVLDSLAGQAVFAAKLLAGVMPEHIEDAFRDAGLRLFPARHHDLETACSCPDEANPCKHIAAVYFLLAEHFDDDPFLVFKLRGRTKDEVISALRKRRDAATEPKAASRRVRATAPAEDPAAFWRAATPLASFTVSPRPADVLRATLRRLGLPPFGATSKEAFRFLCRAYDATARAALHAAHKPSESPVNGATDSRQRRSS
ncbi:hypothetical protein GX586_05435 [bacterium]|nr:hypothetical protein [bacterium]